MSAPAIAPPMTFFLSALGSAFATLVLSSVDVGTTSALTVYVLSFTTIALTRSGTVAFSAFSAGVAEATSSTTVEPAGISLPFDPVSGAFRVATILSPGWFELVHTFDPLVSATALPLEISPCSDAGAGAGAGTIGCG